MKHIIRKAYWNYEKEEKWLNEMSSKGLAFTDYSWCRYVFEDATEGEYIYRIEFLDYPVKHPESKKYLSFLEETGVEIVAYYMRWVYLRKKASEGNFDVYSDIDSKIKHYKKVNFWWSMLAGVEFGAALINIAIGLIYLVLEGEVIFNLIIGAILLIMGFLFLGLRRPLRKKIKKLKNEREIRE